MPLGRDGAAAFGPQQARELAASYGIPLPVFEPKEPGKKPTEDNPDA